MARLEILVCGNVGRQAVHPIYIMDGTLLSYQGKLVVVNRYSILEIQVSPMLYCVYLTIA